MGRHLPQDTVELERMLERRLIWLQPIPKLPDGLAFKLIEHLCRKNFFQPPETVQPQFRDENTRI